VLCEPRDGGIARLRVRSLVDEGSAAALILPA